MKNTFSRLIIIITLMYVMAGAGTIFAAPLASTESSVKVAYVKGDITLTSDSVWKSAKAENIQLLAMEVTNPLRNGTIAVEDIKALNSNARYVFNLSKKAPVVTVKAVHNGKKVAILLTWEDSSINSETAIDTFRDGAAIMFPINSSAKLIPSPLMGSKGEPVNVWQWRADFEAENNGTRNLEARQPQTQSVFAGESDKILKSEFPGKPSPDATCVEYIAEGYGTLTKMRNQNIKAKGIYKDGKWSVEFIRDLKGASDAEFAAGMKTYINLAVWNGNDGDVNGMKSISIVWTPLIFDAVK